jgi:hypothetical protein
MINPETLSGPKSKELFRTFVEDYNTGSQHLSRIADLGLRVADFLPPLLAATLPHDKYYALENYERRMESLRMGETLPESVDSSSACLGLSSMNADPGVTTGSTLTAIQPIIPTLTWRPSDKRTKKRRPRSLTRG